MPSCLQHNRQATGRSTPRSVCATDISMAAARGMEDADCRRRRRTRRTELACAPNELDHRWRGVAQNATPHERRKPTRLATRPGRIYDRAWSGINLRSKVWGEGPAQGGFSWSARGGVTVLSLGAQVTGLTAIREDGQEALAHAALVHVLHEAPNARLERATVQGTVAWFDGASANPSRQPGTVKVSPGAMKRLCGDCLESGRLAPEPPMTPISTMT